MMATTMRYCVLTGTSGKSVNNDNQQPMVFGQYLDVVYILSHCHVRAMQHAQLAVVPIRRLPPYRHVFFIIISLSSLLRDLYSKALVVVVAQPDI